MSETDMMPRHERLLVVEDDGFSQELIALYLRKAGFSDITAATDGRQALDIAKSRTFDLVLLDLNLPRISGTEVLRRLRKEGYLTNTPVIVISSLTNMEETVQCLDLGAEDYLPKPFNVRLLEGRVSACLEKHRLRAAARADLDRRARDRRTAQGLLELMASWPVAPPPAVPQGGGLLPLDSAVARSPAGIPGGDVADLIALPGGALCFVLGTVVERDVAAALAVTRVRVRIRMAVEQAGGAAPDPQALLALVNRDACDMAEDGGASGRRSACLIVGVLDPNTGRLELSNAGSADPVVIGRDGEVRALATVQGRGLGEQPDAVYPVHHAELESGETLVAWTGGVTGTADSHGTLYGEHRLKERLGEGVDGAGPSLGTTRAGAIAQALLDDVRGFAGPAAQDSDRTVVVLRRPGGTDDGTDEGAGPAIR